MEPMQRVNPVCNTGSSIYYINGPARTANFEYGLSTKNEHAMLNIISSSTLDIIQPGSVRAASSLSPLKYPAQYRAEDGFPLQFKDFFVLSTGNVDPRPPYHNCNQIWPSGYKSCWHDKLTGSLFNFEVHEGDESGPTFSIRRYSCSNVPLPIGSTVLTRIKIDQPDGQGKVRQHEFYLVDTEDGKSSGTKMKLWK